MRRFDRPDDGACAVYGRAVADLSSRIINRPAGGKRLIRHVSCAEARKDAVSHVLRAVWIVEFQHIAGGAARRIFAVFSLCVLPGVDNYASISGDPSADLQGFLLIQNNVRQR